MITQSFWRRRAAGFSAAAAILPAICSGQVLDQNFNSVTGSGGGSILIGPGFNELTQWDTGITGERAFAGTAGNARFGVSNALGVTNAGVGGSGAGLVEIADVTFNLLAEDFNATTGAGGGAFLTGNGSPDTFNFTLNWDDGIVNEGAFGGTFGGAVLVGSMSAQGLVSGGFDGLGGGQLDVSSVTLNAGGWFAGLQWSAGAFPGGASLLNAGFENQGVGFGLGEWTVFGNCYTEATTPRTGANVGKMFGNFTGSFNVSGAYQDLAAQPGQVWELDVFTRHNTGDAIAGTQNYATISIEFYDGGGALLQDVESTVLSAASSLDNWIDNAPLSSTAPAGTATARCVISFVQPANGFEGGAALFDDASFRVVGGPPSVDLTQFGLTARFKGTVTSGETLGDVQLRIEDPNGNRLLFRKLATASYQSIGGALSTAIEADANGVPATGVFDVNASSYTVVLAFDNDTANKWGTGGTLEVDDLQLTNADSAGSTWFAGLYFDQLSIDPGTGLDELELSADVRGDVVGGAYTLRLEGFTITDAGLDDNFDSATGVGGGLFLTPTDVTNGITFGFDSDVDTGVEGEGAFGGVFGQVDIFPGSANSGFSAKGLTSGGLSGGAIEIRVEDVVVGPGGGWFAGLSWGEQGLASTDLSQVELSADIRGLTASGGPLGDYELRIEDSEGDRLYFSATATGGWQAIGGPLSTATEGGRLGGGGDGEFDLDSSTYTVAVSFIDPEFTWFFGGVLQVDNLFLTPVQVRNEVGRVSFHGVADGNFQSIGGLLSEGETTFGDFEQDFSTATGTGGGGYGPAGLTNWDDGIVNENAFFGTFGNATTITGPSASACSTCGVGGGSAGQITVGNVTPGFGGWFAGVFFTEIPAELTGDLSQVFLTADIKGTTVAGGSLGTYILRIEDSDLTTLSFEVTANGAFQSVGGALSTAQLVQINTGDGIFNLNQDTYTVTVAYVGTSGNWGNGGTLTIDNISLTGLSLDAADTFTVTLTFADEVATWGQEGSLTLDNLYLGEPNLCPNPQVGCDRSDLFPSGGDCIVNLGDLGQLLANFQPGVGGKTRDQGDVFPLGGGDGFIDLGDLGQVLSDFNTNCQ